MPAASAIAAPLLLQIFPTTASQRPPPEQDFPLRCFSGKLKYSRSSGNKPPAVGAFRRPGFDSRAFWQGARGTLPGAQSLKRYDSGDRFTGSIPAAESSAEY